MEAENLRVANLHEANQRTSNGHDDTEFELASASLPSLPTHIDTSDPAGNGTGELSFSDIFTHLNLGNADFSAGETQPNPTARLRQQLKDFGVWDEISFARELGFGTKPPAEELPNLTDDTLTNILQEMGKFQFFFPPFICYTNSYHRC